MVLAHTHALTPLTPSALPSAEEINTPEYQTEYILEWMLTWRPVLGLMCQMASIVLWLLF